MKRVAYGKLPKESGDTAESAAQDTVDEVHFGAPALKEQ